ncbi:hypothetical protein [Streptomyces griseoviridis]|uniref:hypothetical protein n=1 Tax=Streptomyces griseoviridis TaxID=45398 RepID=UPI00341A4B94
MDSDVVQPFPEPLRPGAVQGEGSSSDRGHVQRQRVDQFQQALAELGPLIRGTVLAGDPGDTTQRSTGTGKGAGVVDTESPPEGLEFGEHLGRGRFLARPGGKRCCVRRPGGHVLPRA